ncbi:MAG: hypothetical protein LLF76_09280 [Planctomycetaceae bacterium]|nr:hypothetical protein [Planctomycetaceae bacterium]
MPDFSAMLASFTTPESIGTTPQSLLWMFPLLAAIALVYKATKMRVLFMRKYLLDSLLLFMTISVFLIAAIIVLNLVDWLITS